MRQLFCFAALVLCVGVFAGCGNTDANVEEELTEQEKQRLETYEEKQRAIHEQIPPP